MQKSSLFPSFFFKFSKIIFLVFVSVYLLVPAADLFQGLRMDALFPFEVALCVGASVVCCGWAVKLTKELIK